MKDNTGQTKQYLEQALRSLPPDFSLQGARSHIIAALNHMTAVEHKRSQRENTQRQLAKMEEDRQRAQTMGLAPWQTWQMSLPQARNALKSLDNMINAELAKLTENQPKPPKPGSSGLIFD